MFSCFTSNTCNESLNMNSKCIELNKEYKFGTKRVMEIKPTPRNTRTIERTAFIKGTYTQ